MRCFVHGFLRREERRWGLVTRLEASGSYSFLKGLRRKSFSSSDTDSLTSGLQKKKKKKGGGGGGNREWSAGNEAEYK